MPTPSILVATWDNGLFSVTGKTVHQELADQSVRSLVADGHGGVLAIVGGHALCRRSAGGQWTEIAKSEVDLSCCVPIGDVAFVGTDDARILRVDPDGAQQHLTATCDGTALLANVHVGGVPRSIDAGLTWRPTIDIESDVHQVRAHPGRPDIVIAAAAAGLCVSRDAGATWTIEQQGLHAHHCSAVALGRNDMFVSAATDPFATQGAVYRRPIDSDGPLKPTGGGFPTWTERIVDTDCIATRDAMVAVIDPSGRLYVSHDDGASWSSPVDRLPFPSGLHIC